jgi:hypothetical protein
LKTSSKVKKLVLLGVVVLLLLVALVPVLVLALVLLLHVALVPVLVLVLVLVLARWKTLVQVRTTRLW